MLCQVKKVPHVQQVKVVGSMEDLEEVVLSERVQ